MLSRRAWWGSISWRLRKEARYAAPARRPVEMPPALPDAADDCCGRGLPDPAAANSDAVLRLIPAPASVLREKLPQGVGKRPGEDPEACARRRRRTASLFPAA